MTIEVTVPATIANLGPGFDALGMAVDLYDRFRVARSDRATVTFSGESAEELNREREPLVARAAAAVARRAGRGQDAAFAIEARLSIPVARGLGSSAASIVGGAVGANHLLGAPLDRGALLAVAADLEGHPDNVAAALHGGVVAVTNGGRRAGRFLPRLDLEIVLVIPDRAVATEQARALLPRSVPLTDAVFNVSRAALLVTALLTGDAALLPAALDDRLHQPYRAPLLPGFADVVAAARQAGAYGAVLAGSGSTVAALTAPGRAEKVGEAMRRAFSRHDVAAAVRVVHVDAHGAAVSE
jgi:homoserine kinase